MNLNADTLLFVSSKHVLEGDVVVSGFLNIVHFCSVVFAVFSGTMIAFLLIKSIRDKKSKALKKVLRDRYQEYLADFVSIPLQDQLASMGITQSVSGLTKSDITKSSSRKILLDELYSLYQQLEGYQAEMLKHLFWGWSMHEETISNLKSRSAIRQIRSLDIIMAFDMKDQLSDVKPLIQANHKDVRSQAMACFVTLTSGDLGFLKDIPSTLTDWEKHKVLAALTKLKNRDQIDLDEWKSQLPVHATFIEELKQNLQPEFAHYANWIEQSVLI